MYSISIQRHKFLKNSVQIILTFSFTVSSAISWWAFTCWISIYYYTFAFVQACEMIAMIWENKMEILKVKQFKYVLQDILWLLFFITKSSSRDYHRTFLFTMKTMICSNAFALWLSRFFNTSSSMKTLVVMAKIWKDWKIRNIHF